MKTVKETQLHYQKGTSNKVYNVYLVEVSSGKYLVNFEYGRFGGNLKEGTKTTSPVDLTKAQKVFDTLVNSKIKKDYRVKEEKKQKERNILSSDEYKALLLERLNRAGEIKTTQNSTTIASNETTGFRALYNRKTITTVSKTFEKIDNYELSRLIYRAGELKIEEAKEIIVDLYNLNTSESNAFYYSVAWALGRYKDPKLRDTITSLREKLDNASRYIVEEALFALNQRQEAMHIEALILPIQFSNDFINQIKSLEERIESTYQSYKDADDYWDEDLRKTAKKELMPLLSQADEVYLKLYMLSLIDKNKHIVMVSIIKNLPINAFNFSLFRRLYKMAEFREDRVVLAELITKIESKKISCYETYDYNSNKQKLSIGCSRLYFKRRSLRYIKNLESHEEENYLDFSKNILLSMNGYEKEFEAFSTDYYDDNWNLKHKKYDAYSIHITFMSILYGAGKRYMLAPSKKVWDIANQSIKDEYRPEMNKELWDKHPKIALEILSKSTIKEVQVFAFNIVKEHPVVIENALLQELLPMLNSHYDEAREFFFELLKKRYKKSNEEIIIETSLFSDYGNIVDYALDIIGKNRSILNNTDLVANSIWMIKDNNHFRKIIMFIKDNENSNSIVSKIIDKLDDYLDKTYKDRTLFMLKKLILGVTIEHIEYLLKENIISVKHYIALKLIRYKEFTLELPLALKEKIAMQNDPEMLATTIYLLGKLSNDELMNAYEMLIAFLYHKEIVVHSEAKNIINNLAQDKDNAKILLQAIVEKTFLSASDEVADNVVQSVKALSLAYSAIDINQLYRMLIAKSKLALRVGTIILSNYEAQDFSVVQWARLAKNQNKSIRVWAYNAYINNVEMVQKEMPKSLMIFDTHWEDTREFASKYFEKFEPLGADDIVVIADSNYYDVQQFAKKIIKKRDFDKETIMLKLSQHPALNIQKFVTDLMLNDMSVEELLKMERFFNTIFHSVNSNRVAKTRILEILNNNLSNKEVAKMIARLASHHSATMVWADKEYFVEAMSYIKEVYTDIQLPLTIEETKIREVL